MELIQDKHELKINQILVFKELNDTARDREDGISFIW